MDGSVEQLSRTHYILDPKPKSKEELEYILKPTNITDKYTEYQKREDINVKYIAARGDKEDDTDESDHADASSKEKKQKEDPKDDINNAHGLKETKQNE